MYFPSSNALVSSWVHLVLLYYILSELLSDSVFHMIFCSYFDYMLIYYALFLTQNNGNLRNWTKKIGDKSFVCLTKGTLGWILGQGVYGLTIHVEVHIMHTGTAHIHFLVVSEIQSFVHMIFSRSSSLVYCSVSIFYYQYLILLLNFRFAYRNLHVAEVLKQAVIFLNVPRKE